MQYIGSDHPDVVRLLGDWRPGFAYSVGTETVGNTTRYHVRPVVDESLVYVVSISDTGEVVLGVTSSQRATQLDAFSLSVLKYPTPLSLHPAALQRCRAAIRKDLHQEGLLAPRVFRTREELEALYHAGPGDVPANWYTPYGLARVLLGADDITQEEYEIAEREFGDDFMGHSRRR